MPNMKELPKGAIEARDTLAFLSALLPVKLDFDRLAANEYLASQPPGTYLLRPSTVQDSVAMSFVSDTGEVKHSNFSPSTRNLVEDRIADATESILNMYKAPGSEITLKTAITNIASHTLTAQLPTPPTHSPVASVSPPSSPRYTPDDDSNLMVISTQAAGANGDIATAIHENIGGGMMHMRDDKSVDENDKQQLQKHFRAEGWLVLAGLGGAQPGLSDVTHSAADFVNAAMQAGNLKKGDHINVLIYASNAASSSPTSDSFSKKVASEFAAQGINTTIIASINPVGNLAQLDKAEGDIDNQLIRFRVPTQDIRILDTTADMRGGVKTQREDKRAEDFVLSRHGNGFRSIVDNSFLESLKKKPESENEVRAFASSLAYLVTRPAGRVLDDARAAQAKKIFAQLPGNDKNRIMDEVKAISPAAYSNIATQNVSVASQSILGKRPPLPTSPAVRDLSTMTPTKKS